MDEVRDLLLEAWQGRVRVMADSAVEHGRLDALVGQTKRQVAKLHARCEALRELANERQARIAALERAPQAKAGSSPTGGQPETAPAVPVPSRALTAADVLARVAAEMAEHGKASPDTREMVRRVMDGEPPETDRERKTRLEQARRPVRREDNWSCVWRDAERRGALSRRAQTPTAADRFVVNHRDGGDGRGNRERKAACGGNGLLAYHASCARIAHDVASPRDWKRVRTVGVKLRAFGADAPEAVVRDHAVRTVVALEILSVEEHTALHDAEPKRGGRLPSGRPAPAWAIRCVS